MRNLTIKREKSAVGCLAKMQVYIENKDQGSEIICGVKAKKLGEIKNGEEKVFEIDNGKTRIFVIAGKFSKGFCNESYQLPEGREDISLTGRNKLNPLTGNAFRFDGNNSEEAKENHKSSVIRGIVVIVIAALAAFLIGFGITSAIFELMGSKEKTFTAGDATITLTEDFVQQYVPGYVTVFVSDDIDITVNEDRFADGGYSGFTATEYARYLMSKNGMEVDKLDEAKNRFTYNTTYDGVHYTCYAYTYKSASAYWLIQFTLRSSDTDKFIEDITKWAGSVSFE